MAETTEKPGTGQTVDLFIDQKAVWVGIGALFIGGLEYVWGRAPNSSHLGQLAQHWIGEYSGTFTLFGPVGKYLPDFLHPFGFICLTLAALPNAGPVLKRLVCAGWLLFNAAFELGQGCGLTLAGMIDRTFPQGRLTAALADYFRFGTFDPCDLIAILMGTLSAWGLHRWWRQKQG